MPIYKLQVKKSCHLYCRVGVALAAINQEQSWLKPLLLFFHYFGENKKLTCLFLTCSLYIGILINEVNTLSIQIHPDAIFSE